MIPENELEWFEGISKRDDLFDQIVPSDVRRMLSMIRKLQKLKKSEEISI